jgi:hypothetical protein
MRFDELSQVPAVKALAGSLILVREGEGELVIQLPSRPRRLVKQIAGGTMLMYGTLFFFLFGVAEDPPLAAVVFLSAFLALVLGLAAILLLETYLTRTLILVTRDTLVVKTVRLGRTALERFELDEHSRASQHWVDVRDGFFQGIDIETRQGPAHFGDQLSDGERDWVEWRINRLLGRPETDNRRPWPSDTTMPDPPLREEAAPPPQATKVRIEERITHDGSETRIHFPTGLETGSLAGLGSAVFGFAWSAYFSYVILQSWGRPHARGTVVMSGLFVCLGLLFLLAGLSQLMGRKRLTINRRRVTYRVSLFGIPLWQSLPTEQILSSGATKMRQVRGIPVAPTSGCVIRTAEGELNYGTAVPREDMPWVMDEVTRRIQTARDAG